MAEVVVGFGGALGIATETAWADQTPATDWLALKSATLNIDQVPVPVEHLLSGQTLYPNVRRSVITKHEVSLDLVTIPLYSHQPFLKLLKHVFGDVAKTGAGPYTYTYTLKREGVVGLTGELYHGIHASVDTAQLLPGLRVNNFEFSVDAAALSECRVNLIGEQALDFDAVSGSPTPPGTDEEIGGHQAGVLTWGSTYELTKLSVRVDHKLTRSPRLGRGLYTAQPRMGGFGDIMVSGRVEFETAALMTAFLAGTVANASMVFTGSGDNQLTVSMDNAMLVSNRVAVDGPGPLAYDFEMRCHGDATDKGISFAVRNALDLTL